MPLYAEVALPVPVDSTFTYELDGMAASVGSRVLVPFRTMRLPGVITGVHDRKPDFAAKRVLDVLDATPVLDPVLLKLGQWIARYYIAPIGEVFRTMLPLAAEMQRVRLLRLTEAGMGALHASAEIGSSRRSKRSVEDQNAEYAVLNYLTQRDHARESSVRSGTRASRAVIEGMLRKGWITREDVSSARDAARTVRIAVATGVLGKLNANQQTLLAAIQAESGRLAVARIRQMDLPQSTLPSLVRRGIVRIEEEAAGFTMSTLSAKSGGVRFTSTQRCSFDEISDAVGAQKFWVALMHGVTGSGKTAVYMAAMQKVLDEGRGAILLVPEIGLTPAAAAEVAEAFGERVAILHSALTDAERAEQWRRIHAGDARVVVGTRSAIFAPVRDLALIIVDEEHDTSYKQEETPRYHARDVAVMRGKLTGCPVVLGSATPSLESYYNAQKQRYQLIEMPGRVQERPLPEVEIIDMRGEFAETGSEQVVSRRLVSEITARLERGEQAILLLNRRGYSAFVLCRTCGEAIKCINCEIALTHHKRQSRLECHYCGYRRAVPDKCPKCGSEFLFFVGTGSEKLEDLLHGLFPTARVGRLDRDTVRARGDLERVLSQLDSGEIDLLAGTQMIAKGHDFHGVTLVGVVGADTALGLPDFRGAERTFQLLTQVAGRAGRGVTPGKVVLQTFFPDHYAIQYAAHHDFAGFYDKELRFRSWMHYPPFNALANVLVRSDRLEQALEISGKIGKWLAGVQKDGVRVLGPAAAPVVRLKREFRYHFVFKSGSREKLNALLRAMLDYAAEQKLPRANIVVDVDPVSLM